MSTATLDPLERSRLEAMSLEELVEEARERQRRGGRVAALRRYRKVLERDPRHPEALVAIARAEPVENVDAVDALYRRAEAVSDLAPGDYLRWAGALESATPRRSRQAADVVRRVRDRFPDHPEVRAFAALRLAQLGDLMSAEVVVSELAAAKALDDDTSRNLVLVVGMLLGEGGPWTDRYAKARSVLEQLTRLRGRRTLVEAARLAWQQDYPKSALSYLDRFKDSERQAGSEGMDELAAEATLLRAYIYADYEQYDVVIPLLDSLPYLNDWQKLIRIGALHGAGRLDEAEQCCGELLDPVEGEQPSEWNHPEILVRAILLRAALSYDQGRFRCYWDLIQTAIKVNPEGLSPLLRAALETSKCLLDVASADSALCELKALRSEPRLSRRERDQLELSRVETLVWLAGRSEKFRLRAEVAAREALARARARGEVARERSSADEMRKDEAGLAEARAAYLALLADDDHVARVIFEGTPERPDSWRVMALRATTAVRTLRPEDALVLTQEVLERRRHDLDRRCSLVHAALLAEQTAFAIREAAGVVQLAPDHVLGRLLYAESLYLGAGAPDSKGNEDYQQLILACKQYAKTLRLHNGLDAFLSRWQAAGPVGSELLSDEILEHAARQCAHAAVRASHALARAGLPPDRAMLKNGDYALSRLYWVDRQEAIRLQSLLGRPRRDKRRRWLKWAACLSFGTAIGVGVVVDWWGSQRLDEIGVRPAVAGLALLIAIFPLVRKISIFGVDLEPPEAVDLLGASGNILLGGIASVAFLK